MMQTLSDYHRALIDAVSRFAREKFGAEAYTPEVGEGFPRHYFRLLAEQGWAGIFLPEEVGGQGGALLDAVLAIEAAARVSPAAGDALQALNFGAIQQLARYGSEDLTTAYLAACLAGDKVITVAMTEPEAGSAVTDLQTRATTEGDNVILNGRKVFTTHGGYADYFVVWAKFGATNQSAGAVIVERGAPGLTIDASHTFMSGEHYGMLYLDHVQSPRRNILLDANGFRRLLPVFNIERLGNASRALGLGQAAFDLAVSYAKERRQFGRRLADFQGLQWRVAEMKVKLEGARLLLYSAASNADAGLPSAIDTAMAKLACNRAGFEVANDALQMFGGYGYDQEAPINYIFRRTRGWMIAGGTLEQMLNRIAAEVFGEHFSQRPSRQ